MFEKLDHCLSLLKQSAIIVIALIGVSLLGIVDYLSGRELAIGIFYLGPVALAAWYAGRAASISIATVACIAWYIADTGPGMPYSHAAIPVWNALVRFGFFLSNALLLSLLRKHFFAEKELARTDAVTGVMNRRAFSEQLDYSLALGQRHPHSLTLAYVDLDDFKKINDTLGHNEGDRVLRTVAQALRNSSRRTDIVARMGGDEFVVLLPQTDASGAQAILGEIKRQLDSLCLSGELSITCSIGAVVFPLHLPSAGDAVKAADQLMYQVKQQGKNAIAFGIFDPKSGGTIRWPLSDSAP